MLNKLRKTTTRKAKRVGRGYGSGKGGHTIGKGQKGQKSRSGYKPARRGFEGGQMPLSRRIPKLKGFTRAYFKARENSVVINLRDLNTKFSSGETVNIEQLITKGYIRSKSKINSVKILGHGEITKKINVSGVPISEAAKAKIQAKGGKVA